MYIILFGPPGAGKGTQANKLVNEFNLHKVSTGDLLREEVKNKTEEGKVIKLKIDKGSLVSDTIISNLIKKVLLNKDINQRIIFDGYPRNLKQAKELDLLLKKNKRLISCVLSLAVDKESLVKRVLGRQICSKCGLIFNKYFKPANKINHECDSKFLETRSDDNELTIKNRFDTYVAKTLPILNYYRDQNLLHEVNGMAKIDDIYMEIRGIIASIET